MKIRRNKNKWNIKIYIFYLFLLLNFKLFYQPSDLQGLWSCTISEKNIRFEFLLEIEPDSSWRIRGHVPAMGFLKIPLDSLKIEQSALSFRGFEGRLINNTIEGYLTLLGYNGQVLFSPADKLPETTISAKKREPVWIISTDAPIWSAPVVHDNMVLFGNEPADFMLWVLKMA